MASPASIARHPLHPMMVPIPIGLWIFSLVCDLIYAAGWGGVLWNDMAFYTMAGGLIGALLAALPGLMDYRSLTDSPAKKTAMVHMLMNLTIVVLFAVNLWWRTQRPPDVGGPLFLSIVGVVLLGISGWLGGELVYIHGVAVEPRHDVLRQERERQRVG
jgi:uncharacterized membrane protein